MSIVLRIERGRERERERQTDRQTDRQVQNEKVQNEALAYHTC